LPQLEKIAGFPNTETLENDSASATATLYSCSVPMGAGFTAELLLEMN